MRFAGQQLLQNVHAEGGVRLAQKKSSDGEIVAASAISTASKSGIPTSQDVELTAPTMDFSLKNGRQLVLAETSGPPQIVIDQLGVQQKTSITAGKFTFNFTEQNRLASLHGDYSNEVMGDEGFTAV